MTDAETEVRFIILMAFAQHRPHFSRLDPTPVIDQVVSDLFSEANRWAVLEFIKEEKQA